MLGALFQRRSGNPTTVVVGPETLMIGKILWQEFFNNRDWPVASALAIVMLLVLIPIMIFNYSRQRDLVDVMIRKLDNHSLVWLLFLSADVNPDCLFV